MKKYMKVALIVLAAVCVIFAASCDKILKPNESIIGNDSVTDDKDVTKTPENADSGEAPTTDAPSTSAPDGSDAPEITVTPETTDAPETTYIPVETIAPVTTTAPSTSKAPETTNSPEIVEVTIANPGQLPNIPYIPDTVAPETQPSTPETTGRDTSNDLEIDMVPGSLTYREFISLSPRDQQNYTESFDSIEAFGAWYTKALAEYQKETAGTEISGDGEINIGDFVGGGN